MYLQNCTQTFSSKNHCSRTPFTKPHFVLSLLRNFVLFMLGRSLRSAELSNSHASMEFFTSGITRELLYHFPTLTFWSSPRPISSSQLHALQHFHPCPINLVVFKGSYFFRMGYLILRGASRLDAFSVYPVPTWLPGRGVDRQPVHQRSVHPGPLVLRTAPLRYPTPTPDRDRTVSRRSEPSSRTALMGEQPNPWDRLQPQDAMSRHRGAKPLRRCELLGVISLLSPG